MPFLLNVHWVFCYMQPKALHFICIFILPSAAISVWGCVVGERNTR